MVHQIEMVIITKINQDQESNYSYKCSYNISSKNQGPKISMSNRFGRGGLGGNSFTPGPGNYNTSGSVIRPSSGVTMGAKYGASKILN